MKGSDYALSPYDIALSSRSLVLSSQSDLVHSHHLHTGIMLDPADHIIDPDDHLVKVSP
jgi:hypothetical protein